MVFAAHYVGGWVAIRSLPLRVCRRDSPRAGRLAGPGFLLLRADVSRRRSCTSSAVSSSTGSPASSSKHSSASAPCSSPRFSLRGSSVRCYVSGSASGPRVCLRRGDPSRRGAPPRRKSARLCVITVFAFTLCLLRLFLLRLFLF